jgi:hypothetical protein
MQQFLQFIILTFIYSSTCFGRPHAHHQELNCSGSLWFYLRSVVIAVLSIVFGPAGPITNVCSFYGIKNSQNQPSISRLQFVQIL